eukprot:RCo035365
MYNGIGLSTPRGTGTNGFIQKNFAAIKPSSGATYDPKHLPKTEKIQRFKHKDIQLHESKRRIELAIASKREELLDAGLSTGTVDQILSKLREELTSDADNAKQQELRAREEGRVLRPNKTLEDFGRAFGISTDYQEGAAFDKELQEQKKQEAQLRKQALELRQQKELEDRKQQEAEAQAKAIQEAAEKKRLEKEQRQKLKEERRKEKKAAKKEQKRAAKEAARKAKHEKVKAEKGNGRTRERSRGSHGKTGGLMEVKKEPGVVDLPEHMKVRAKQIIDEKRARDASRLERKTQQEQFHASLKSRCSQGLSTVVVPSRKKSPDPRPRRSVSAEREDSHSSSGSNSSDDEEDDGSSSSASESSASSSSASQNRKRSRPTAAKDGSRGHRKEHSNSPPPKRVCRLEEREKVKEKESQRGSVKRR